MGLRRKTGSSETGRRGRPGVLTASLLLLLLVPGAETQAYLDPGTGSMLLQVILGGIAAVGVAVKLYWHKLAAVFGLRKTEEADDDPV